MKMAAEFILKIAETEPERLFLRRSELSHDYKNLMREWHPDMQHADGPIASKVTAHINVLFDAACKKDRDGSWSAPGQFAFKATNGKSYQFAVGRRESFDLGEAIYNQNYICYVIRQDYADLVENARQIIKGLKYSSVHMQEEMVKRLPHVEHDLETIDGRQIIVMRKQPDEFSIAAGLEYFGSKIDPSHVAWMMNCIYDIACYLDYAGIAHNSISPDALFMSAKRHTIGLLGGWWFARPKGAKLNAMSRRAFEMASPAMRTDKKASGSLDRLMIRALGRELLGDASGMSLHASAPKPMVDFLRGVPGRKAVKDYEYWQEVVLPACFGARRFVEMKIDKSAIYGT